MTAEAYDSLELPLDKVSGDAKSRNNQAQKVINNNIANLNEFIRLHPEKEDTRRLFWAQVRKFDGLRKGLESNSPF